VASFDVCDRAAADAAIDEIERRHGRLDILINNAAWGVPHDLFETTDDECGACSTSRSIPASGCRAARRAAW
jgi:NAD(P)-dependent dehydrogenase (short-subunit alcohol dehydrogenase family)